MANKILQRNSGNDIADNGKQPKIGIIVPQKPRFVLAAPKNCEIDRLERQNGFFACGLNIYKLLLVCFAGCFLGVAVELVWCCITRGYLESRSGLVYGPFNMLYGAATVMLTVVLYPFRNRNFLWSFFVGGAAATAFEYFCSWFQETVFNSRSWDYSDAPLNINGRVCLLYSVYWAILSIWWIKDLYPRLCALFLKLPQRGTKVAAILLSVFLLFDCAVTFAANCRREERARGLPASNIVDRVMDDRFPDERLDKIFANCEQLGTKSRN